ncbi:solute carrier family 23 member 1-like [Haliotis asinina]|uniref:solute carrier family 23 member 1-like n=1 Tax=Haliotis asinina TaxID=109174 RepID=UPI003531ABF0
MAASLVEMVIGGTGLVGRLLRFVGPITVAPTIALIGLSLYKIPIRYSTSSWELSLTGACLVVVFSLYLGHVKIPLSTRTNCKPRGKSTAKIPGVRLFQLLPVLMSILVVWAISGILTCTDVFPSDPDDPRFRARADAKSKLIHMTPWFYLPHPGQFGPPSFSLALCIGFMATFFASLIESVGDYFAAAKACEVDAPPTDAVNRGILLEGIGGLISGAVGVGHATTSYSANIAAMTLTKTANRYILICAGVIMILLSVVGKFGAVLATIPDPALGGTLAVIYGMLVSLGLSTLQYVNLNSPRNLLILGLAFFIGIFVPEWIDRYPDIIRTGSREADSVLKVVLGTPMFLGGVIAILLDNTTRGPRKDRGIDAWQVRPCTHKDSRDTEDTNSGSATYACSCTSVLYKYLPCCSKLPFMPAYDKQTRWTDDGGSAPMIIYGHNA